MTKKNIAFSCSDCAALACRAKNESRYPAFCLTEHVDNDQLAKVMKIYEDDKEMGDISRISAGIEGEFYGRLTRVEETIKFIQPLYEPQDVGTDDSGIYEMVIEAAVIYEKGKTGCVN